MRSFAMPRGQSRSTTMRCPSETLAARQARLMRMFVMPICPPQSLNWLRHGEATPLRILK
jgi:hypothetical protein